MKPPRWKMLLGPSALLCQSSQPHIRPMAKNPDHPKKPVKTPKSKAHRPDVQPIGPALAELLNPAINRGEAGVGSTTGTRSVKGSTPLPNAPPQGGREKNSGLQPPPDNS